jgi:predicted transcriptional regulator
LRPVLETLVSEANTDTRLSPEARHIMYAIAGTGPKNTLTLADLTERASTPKARVLTALNELGTRSYLDRLTQIAPHLAAALPAHTHPQYGDAL